MAGETSRETGFREGNYPPVRLAGFEALFLTKWFTRKSLARYIFAVISHDPSRIVRRFVAQAAIASLGILEAVGDIKPATKDTDKSVLIEEDGSTPQASAKGRRNEVDLALKAIRKEAGKQKGIRDAFIPMYM